MVLKKIPWTGRPIWHQILQGMVGSFLGIGLVAYLALELNAPVLIASLGASAILLYAVPSSPVAQPKNVIGGHFFSALIGVLLVNILGMDWWVIGLSVSLAVMVMMLTNTLHPPGGGTAILAVLAKEGVLFPFAPVLIGSILLVLVALLNNYLFSKEFFVFCENLIDGGNHTGEDYHSRS